MFIINLFNREIIGYSAGPKKDAILVYEAFLNSSINLSKIKIFHPDRGNEFKNNVIDIYEDINSDLPQNSPDKNLNSLLIYDTSALKTRVKENNPKSPCN